MLPFGGKRKIEQKEKSFFIDKKIAENNHQLIASEKNFPNIYFFNRDQEGR